MLALEPSVSQKRGSQQCAQNIDSKTNPQTYSLPVENVAQNNAQSLLPGDNNVLIGGNAELFYTCVRLDDESGAALARVARKQADQKTKKDNDKRQQYRVQRQERRKFVSKAHERAHRESPVDDGDVRLEIADANSVGIGRNLISIVGFRVDRHRPAPRSWRCLQQRITQEKECEGKRSQAYIEANLQK